MKTFFFTISFLALLGSPASCVMGEMNQSNQQSAQKDGDNPIDNTVGTNSPIDPPIMPTKP